MLKFFDRLEEWLIAFLIGAATLITFASVVHRYLSGIEFFQPVMLEINFGWAVELTIYMFVWMAKIGAAYGVRTGIHVGVDVMINRFDTPLRNKFVLFGLFAGALFTFLIGSMGAHFVWGNGMAYATYTAFGIETMDYFEGPTTPDLEWPTWIVYTAIPFASFLMCARFLQVAWIFNKTGELPHHDHGHVDGIDDTNDTVAIGEAVVIAEEREHADAGKARKGE